MTSEENGEETFCFIILTKIFTKLLIFFHLDPSYSSALLHLVSFSYEFIIKKFMNTKPVDEPSPIKKESLTRKYIKLILSIINIIMSCYYVYIDINQISKEKNTIQELFKKETFPHLFLHCINIKKDITQTKMIKKEIKKEKRLNKNSKVHKKLTNNPINIKQNKNLIQLNGAGDDGDELVSNGYEESFYYGENDKVTNYKKQQ